MFSNLHLIGFGDGGWGWALLQGAGVTISIALATLPFGLALGLAIALMARSGKPRFGPARGPTGRRRYRGRKAGCQRR
jgi:ABC-type amino acid transport system permease subunit